MVILFRYMNRHLFVRFSIAGLWLIFFTESTNACAQPPAINYGRYKLFTKDSAIDFLSPVNLGGAVPQTIYSNTTTFAGNDIPGLMDGKETHAAFNHPSKIAVDKYGNLYVSDELNNTIRKITPEAVVTTLAGNGKTVLDKKNRLKTFTGFNGPGGIAIDRAGNVYVADVFNHTIKKITPSGAVTNFAGNGQAGFKDDVKAASAMFNFPVDLAVDETGNVYVVDEGNNKIRKITTSGSVSTFAGSGSVGALDHRNGILATFNQPDGIAIDSKGNLYITDQLNHKIRKITPGGTVSTMAGNGAAGSADNNIGILASFNNPRGIAVDPAGNVYVGDVGNQKIRLITPAGAVSTLAGSGAAGSRDNANGSLAEFYFPNGIALDSMGNLYVADCLNNKIRKIETKGYSIKPELLPEGLHFNYKTGVISGTPTENVINNTYTVTAYNIYGSNATNLTIDVATQPGNALSFDGFDDRVIIPDAEILKTPVISIELWVNFKNLSSNFGRIIVKRNDLPRYDDSYSIGVDSLRKLTAGVCSGSGTAEGQKFAVQKSTLIPNTWYYVAAVFTTDSIKLYVNGVFEQATYTGFPLSKGKNGLFLGFDEKMVFVLDEVRIFNTDRSALIASDMHNTLSPATPGLAAYYNFNTGKSDGQNAGLITLIDLTSHGNNGVLSNFHLVVGNNSNWVESYAMVVPIALQAININDAGFTAVWTKPPLGEVTDYLLDISTYPDFSSFVAGYKGLTVAGTSQRFIGLDSETTYYYRVRADKVSVSGQGGYSNTIRVN